MQQQTCNRCDQIKGLDEFQKTKGMCRACTKQVYTERRQAELTSGEAKTCIHCEKTGPVQEFISLKNICKDCDKKKKMKRHLDSKEANATKTCSACLQTKPFEDFKKTLSMCKVCVNAKEQARRGQWSNEKRQEEHEKNRAYYQRVASNVPDQIEIQKDAPKKCTVCQEIRPTEEFYLHKRKGTVRSACKECTKELKRQYYEENKEEYIKKTDAYKKMKMQTDPAFHLERRMRCRVYAALTKVRIPKKERTVEYLGCTASFFQKWIAFQLYDGMDMENYGEVWHIDHTKPIASFNLLDEEERKSCFSWVNCRPLIAAKNISKSSTYKPFDSVLQELKARIFMQRHSLPPATVDDG